MLVFSAAQGRSLLGPRRSADFRDRLRLQKTLAAVMSRFFAGMICGALLLFLVMHYHIVREEKGVVLVPKISNNLSAIYTDIREFDLQDWQNHKPLAAAIMRSSHSDMMRDSAHRSFAESVRRNVDEFFSR